MPTQSARNRATLPQTAIGRIRPTLIVVVVKRPPLPPVSPIPNGLQNKVSTNIGELSADSPIA